MKRPALALILAAVLLLAACGDDDDATTASTTATESTGTEGATGATGGGSAESEPCPGADSPPNITNVTSYGVDCSAVEDAMSKIGSISTQFELSDFSCERTEGGELAGVWRCDGEAAYFTFDFAD